MENWDRLLIMVVMTYIYGNTLSLFLHKLWSGSCDRMFNLVWNVSSRQLYFSSLSLIEWQPNNTKSYWVCIIEPTKKKKTKKTSYTTLKRSSNCSIFLSTNLSTCSTSSTEWSWPFTRCKYKSVFVLSTEPSLFSCTLRSSMLTTESVTRAKRSRNTCILSRISDGWDRRTKRTRWSSRSR